MCLLLDGQVEQGIQPGDEGMVLRWLGGGGVRDVMFDVIDPGRPIHRTQLHYNRSTTNE